MNVLCIDTSCDALTIALRSGEKIYTFKSMSARQGHSVMLLPEIEKLLSEASITVQDVDFFGVVVGPGSFTGIRVGVATVNAFAYANCKPVVEVTAFEPFAYIDTEGESFAIDAKHGNYYFAKRKGEDLIYQTIEGEPLPDNCKIISVTDVTPESLLGVVESKIKNEAIVKFAKPVYMRASEAERNKK